MNAYIYQADIYCEDCGERIKAINQKRWSLAWQTAGVSVEPFDHEDSDHLPQGPYPDGGGEADTPQHCAGCMIPLGNPLTAEGVEYVFSAIREELANPDRWKTHPNYDGSYYEGSPHIAILRDWADEVCWYVGLTEEQEVLLDEFYEEWSNYKEMMRKE
jgi:hypothetical protein